MLLSMRSRLELATRPVKPLKVDEVANLGAEGVGELAEHVEPDAHATRLNLPQIGVRGARHACELPHGETCGNAPRLDVVS